MIRLVVSTCAGIVVFGAALWAQTPPPPAPVPQPDPNPPPATTQPPAGVAQPRAGGMQVRKSKQIIGSRISIQGGISIGTVDEIIFSDEGCIDYLVVINEGKYVLVPWQAAKFNFEQQAATVNITQARFREVPVFTAQQWPNVYEPAYMNRIYGYYGVTVPERHRHIERRR